MLHPVHRAYSGKILAATESFSSSFYTCKSKVPRHRPTIFPLVFTSLGEYNKLPLVIIVTSLSHECATLTTRRRETAGGTAPQHGPLIKEKRPTKGGLAYSKTQEEAKSIESTNASQTKAARKIDTSQFEPSWNDDDIDSLFQPAIHWKTIIETGRKARRKMEHCSAKMYEYETKLRQEALELQKDSNLPDSLSKLSHFEPYRKAFIDFQNTQTALDSLNKMSDQVYDQVQNAIHNSLRSAKPLMETLSDPVEKNWLNSVNASLVLQSSVNDFYDALASKVREPSDNHDSFNQRMLSAWRNAHIQRETFLRCSSMVLDALRSGASSMDPRTPWSKVKELGSSIRLIG